IYFLFHSYFIISCLFVKWRTRIPPLCFPTRRTSRPNGADQGTGKPLHPLRVM
ncbi:hypothetical protein SK128_006489, partial [Halocaridina rubra]